MCGIALYFNEKKEKTSSWIDNALQVMNYRGPDNSEKWESKCHNMLLGHNRLAIVDLSDAGNQPMHSKNGRYSIIFNGEIYNYKELIYHLKQVYGIECEHQNDTSVILEMYQIYKEKMLSHFKGMYAFAIWDENSAETFIARDPVGEKPLYYKANKSELFVASELKPFLYEVNEEVNKESIFTYFTKGHLGYQSALCGIELVQPGCWLRFKGQKIIDAGQHNKLNFNINQKVTLSVKEHADHVEQLMIDSLRLQMQSDVPNAFLLSGGLDSSLLVCMAKTISEDINTFTVKMGYSRLDESLHANQVVDHVGTRHIEIGLNDLTEEEVYQILAAQDEPQADSSFIPTFKVYEAVSKYFKVAIGGDGGDELFGGYEHYSIALQSQRRRERLKASHHQKVIKLVSSLMPYGMPGRNYLTRLQSETDITRSKMNYMDDNEFITYYTGIHKRAVEKYEHKSNDLLLEMRYQDLTNYLPNNILRKIDRASMLNSVESRSPFLSKELIKYAFEKLESKHLISMNNKKIILKKIAKKYLPNDYEYDRKQGFQFPLNNYIKSGKLDGIINDYVVNNDIGIDRKYAQKLLNQNKFGFSNSEKIFSILSFSIWFEKNKDCLRET